MQDIQALLSLNAASYPFNRMKDSQGWEESQIVALGSIPNIEVGQGGAVLILLIPTEAVHVNDACMAFILWNIVYN